MKKHLVLNTFIYCNSYILQNICYVASHNSSLNNSTYQPITNLEASDSDPFFIIITISIC